MKIAVRDAIWADGSDVLLECDDHGMNGVHYTDDSAIKSVVPPLDRLCYSIHRVW